MPSPKDPGLALHHLFQRRRTAELKDLFAALKTRSRMTVFRRLSSMGYLSSYSHNGRFYTLSDVPDFDRDGLWQHAGVGFSRDGTLKETVARLVNTADAGLFHSELQLRLHVRVHNTLADLVVHRRIDRERLQGEYLYVGVDGRRAKSQVARRRLHSDVATQGTAAGDAVVDPPLVIEVLSEVIHGSVVGLDAQEVAARLVARGVAVSATQVEQVFRRHGVRKKTAPSRSPRSRR